MHLTAYKNAESFFEKFCKNMDRSSRVVDFGAYDVNGTMKPIFSPHFGYIGIDMEKGPNVDIVCKNDSTPFVSNSIEIVVSNSSFEHDTSFWTTFLEMVRICKPNGYIYINAPSQSHYHPFPVDCWRFYKDSWKALEQWAIKNNHSIELVETYIDEGDHWKNSVGIFKKTWRSKN